MKEITATKIGREWVLSNGQTLREFAISNNMKYKNLQNHLSKGRSLKEAMKLYGAYPSGKTIIIHYQGRNWTFRELANSPHNKSGCTTNTLRNRVILQKWSIDRALIQPVDETRNRRINYIYDGVVYKSITEICETLGLNTKKFRQCINDKLSVGEAVELSRPKEIDFIEYKGKQYRLNELESHPDNIHGVSYSSLVYRVRISKMSVEEAFSKPMRLLHIRDITYKGVTYENLFRLVSVLGLKKYHKQLTGIYDADILEQEIERLLNNKKEKDNEKPKGLQFSLPI